MKLNHIRITYFIISLLCGAVFFGLIALANIWAGIVFGVIAFLVAWFILSACYVAGRSEE